MTCFKSIPTQVCVVLNISLSEAIVRYRARIFLLDAIHSKSHKSNCTVIAKISCAAAQKTKTELNIMVNQWSKYGQQYHMTGSN